MAGHSRYEVSDSVAGFSRGLLKNKLGITDQKELEDVEALLLQDAYAYFIDRVNTEKVIFDLSFLYIIHEFFLGTVYSWAGKTRKIDISKDGILFAPSRYLKESLNVFENILSETIPTTNDTKKIISQKLALIHNEYNALHPFREGNGRTIRLFLDLLVYSIGYLPVDWGKTSPNQYVQACVDGMKQNHAGMERIIFAGLKLRK